VSRPDERYLVVTEHGRVLVVVRGDRDGLDPDLIEVRGDADAAAADVGLETPLRAFAAKMVDLVQARGEGAAALSPALAAMMIKEKAAEDLRRIERAARRLHAADAGGGPS
jgi:hypothetical protein